jgi:hypothetical protein
MRRILLPALLLLALAVPAVAQASYQDVIKDCLDPAHGEQLTKTYTNDEYAQALKKLPTDAREYTGCYDVIRSAMLDVARGGDGKSDGGGATGGGTGTGGTGTGAGAGGAAAGPSRAVDPLATAAPADQAAAAEATQAGGHAVRVGAAMITPGDPGTTASSLGALPAPLLVMLGALALAALAGLAVSIKHFVLRRTSS